MKKITISIDVDDKNVATFEIDGSTGNMDIGYVEQLSLPIIVCLENAAIAVRSDLKEDTNHRKEMH